MKNRSGRRSFLKSMGIGSTAAALFPAGILHANTTETNIPTESDHDSEATHKHQYNGEYRNEYLNRVAFPMGGFGAGMICLEGTGTLSHVSVKNKADIYNE